MYNNSFDTVTFFPSFLFLFSQIIIKFSSCFDFALQVVLKSYYDNYLVLTNAWSDYFKNKDTINAQFSKREIDFIGCNSFVLYKTYLFTYAILIVFFSFYNLIKPQIFKKCKYNVSYYTQQKMSRNEQLACSKLMKTVLNNILLPTLF